jgi:hypothetical protein
MPPLHATSTVLPPEYFWPPSRPEHPINRVIAFYGKVAYYFYREAVGEPWILYCYKSGYDIKSL